MPSFISPSRPLRSPGRSWLRGLRFICLALTPGLAVLSGVSAVQAQPGVAERLAAVPSAARGAVIFQHVCSACHGLDRLQYADLLPLLEQAERADSTNAQKAHENAYRDLLSWAATRHATLASPIASPYPDPAAAKAANGGDMPPDLSVIVRTIRGGPAYVQAMLEGYRPPPPGLKLGPATYYNPVALTHHHRFHMPPPFHDGMDFGPYGQSATVTEMARDVTAFLVWSAWPHARARLLAGYGVLAYLAVLTAIMAGLTCLIWRCPPFGGEETQPGRRQDHE
ncbi:cytochrome c1 [Oecophyllibacter saccharovorans]|nr:cytochrome c1 [Oecophyllibacter saccharovorans]